MSELTIKDKRKLPTKLLVDTYKEVGSYRGAARKLGVSVQFLHKRIKKHGGKDITTKEFINYHAMTREQLEAYIDSAITEARIEAATMGARFGNAAFRQQSIAEPGKPINLDVVLESGIQQAQDWAKRTL